MPHSYWRSVSYSLLIGFWLTVSGAQVSAADDPAATSPQQRVAVAVDTLMRYYDRDTGLWNTEGWWNAANSVTTLADAASVEPTVVSREFFQTTFLKAQNKFRLFRNEYNDDEGWWALAWIRVYDLTGRRAYLSMAKSLFRDMSNGWDSTCGGGIWWKKDRHYKNAIANELFLSVAAGLARRTKGRESDSYKEWANREWQWFQHSGMINKDHLVNDGLTAACENNHRTTWTYNQGVILGGLVDLERVDDNPELLQKAREIANAALDHLPDANNVLHDPTEPHCSEDTVQFKGIFVRNLQHLHEAAPDSRYAAFFRANAETIWNAARTPENEVSCSWSGPPANRGAGALSSALDTLVADAAARQQAETNLERTRPGKPTK